MPDVLGFTPMETLVVATLLGDEIMSRPDELGQVKPGYLADLSSSTATPHQRQRAAAPGRAAGDAITPAPSGAVRRL